MTKTWNANLGKESTAKQKIPRWPSFALNFFSALLKKEKNFLPKKIKQ